MMKKIKLALGFLTIIPIHGTDPYLPGDIGRAAGWFPWIGALLGLIVAGVYYGLSQIFAPLLAAVLSLATWITLTGGLHLDGLADSCDGLLNASNKERRLEIMKDPRLGPFGGIGLILIILLKFACLYSLPTHSLWFALPLAAGLGRWLLLWAGKQPLARPSGLAVDFASGLNKNSFILGAMAVFFLAVLAGYAAGWHSLAAVAFVHLLAWLIFKIANSRLGGMTGDIFGFIVELSEAAAMLIFCFKP